MKKLLFIILTGTLLSAILCGCSALRKEESKAEIGPLDQTNNAGKLYDGQYYVWHDEEQSNIEKDINCDGSKFKDYNYKIFKPVYTDEELSDIVMMLDKNDENIPVYREGDCLLYYSETKLPTSFSFTKYYDHGYSLGIYGITENIKYSGQYVLKSDGKIKKGSSVQKIRSLFENVSKVSITSIGEISPSPNNISTIGSLKGLIQGSQYEVCVYAGTNRYILDKAVVDTRIFSEMESYTGYTYRMVSDGVMVIDIPPYFESGYYSINGAGIFKYVKDSDEDDFNVSIDPEAVDAYEQELILKQEEIELTDDDFINDTNISSTDIRAYSVNNNESLTITLSVGNIVDTSVKNYPEIMVYNASVLDNSEYGKNNAVTHVFKIAEGEGDSFNVNLGAGHYIIVLKNIKNYDKYLMSFSIEEVEDY